MLRIVIPALVLFSCSGCFETVPECENPIQDIDADCIPHEIQKLDSDGGLLYPAFDIADRVQTTVVTKNCLSACVVVAMSAETRIACTNSSFGVHRATTDYGQKDMEEFFKSDPRVKGEWLAVMSSVTPYTQMYYFSAYVALDAGIVDKVVNCDLNGDPV